MTCSVNCRLLTHRLTHLMSPLLSGRRTRIILIVPIGLVSLHHLPHLLITRQFTPQFPIKIPPCSYEILILFRPRLRTLHHRFLTAAGPFRLFRLLVGGICFVIDVFNNKSELHSGLIDGFIQGILNVFLLEPWWKSTRKPFGMVTRNCNPRLRLWKDAFADDMLENDRSCWTAPLGETDQRKWILEHSEKIMLLHSKDAVASKQIVRRRVRHTW